eukprot:gene28606-35483_t
MHRIDGFHGSDMAVTEKGIRIVYLELGGGSVVSGNSATRYGGGIRVDNHVETVVAARSVIEDNFSGRGGGGMSVEKISNVTLVGGSQLSILAESSPEFFPDVTSPGVFLTEGSTLVGKPGSVFTENYAVYSAGHIYVAFSNLTLVGSWLSWGSTLGAGGGVCLGGSSTAIIRNCTISESYAVGNGGGFTVSASQLLLEDTWLHGNAAGINGGAVQAYAANVSLVGCTAASNAAEGAGGAVWAGQGMILELRTTNVTNSTAADGAGIALSSDVAEVTISEVTLENGKAQRGGAIFLHPHSEPGVTLFSQLSFCNNTAGVGENIYWVCPQNFSAAAQPTCSGCVHPEGTSLFVTDAVRYEVLQDGAALQAEGARAASGTVLSPAAMYVALDFYGNVTALP